MKQMLLVLCCVCCSPVFAQPQLQTWQVNGVKREALVYLPQDAKAVAMPVVLVFHGHGGSMQNTYRQFRYHEHWPEACSIYLQGLNTPGQLTDPEGKKTGWQKSAGDQQDRDLKFVDIVLAWLRSNYRVDDRRIYSTGHSNGGGFTYLLWAERGAQFAAFAPSGSAAIRMQGKLQPRPLFHVAGSNDPLVKFAWQQFTIQSVKRRNGCAEGRPDGPRMTRYESSRGTPVVTWISTGGHKFPVESVPAAVSFLKQHQLPLPDAASSRDQGDKASPQIVPGESGPDTDAEESVTPRERIRSGLRQRLQERQP